MPILIHLSAPRQGQRFVFSRSVILGRGQQCDVVLPEASVSRRHAQISVADERCFLVDLGSGNGTFLNGEHLAEPTPLVSGDEVRVGTAVLEFRLADSPRLDGTRSRTITIRDAARDSGPLPLVIPLANLQLTGPPADELERMRRKLEFFRQAGVVLTRTLNERELFDALLEKAMAVLPQAGRAFILRRDPESGELASIGARTRSGAVEEIPASRTLIDAVIRRREPLASVDVGAEAGFEVANSVRHLNLRAVACLPLLVEDRLVGVMQVDNTEERRGFSADDLDLLSGIAGPIALAMEHSRLHEKLVERDILEHDLALARRLQRSFLPQTPPQVPGYGLAVEYSPAAEVGGDFYDFFPLASGRIGLAIGDVSGKGVSGALLMARLTSVLRAAAARSEHPASVLEELNELVFAENDEGMFVTANFAVLDPESGRLEIANAGHLLPIVRHRDGRAGELKLQPGSALGVSRPLLAPAASWTMSPGDLMLFATDGLTEAANHQLQRFGNARIIETLRRLASDDPSQAINGLLTAARSFVGDHGFDDDLTLLCLTRA
ncbi:MAG: SpoIIE family protein phosphatase [Thermoanaerobaculia bacterium]|nr:SpoIIE family protein phosphatase [Thermoanaerobaculia bacterium]